MDSLLQYASDEEKTTKEVIKSISIQSAPIITNNPTSSHQLATLNLNQQPNLKSEGVVGGLIKGSTVTGYIENYHINSFVFDDHYSRAFDQKTEKKRKNKKRKEVEEGVVGFIEESNSDIVNSFSSEAFLLEDGTTQSLEAVSVNKKQKLSETSPTQQESIFHLENERDYLGRTFMAPPSYLKPIQFSDVQSFVPKKLMHAWKDHTKGVSAIEFFPNYGHLLLSSSNDSTIKIYDVLDHRKCIQSYVAHNQAVKKIQFDSSGTHFASCSFDNCVKYWDTETGKVLASLTHNNKTPHCVAIHPTQTNEILVGFSNKKIIQWDLRTKEVIQEYDRHLSAVNTVTFVNDGKQFVSSSDDKTLRFWDYGIAVEVKFIADPMMHSMPAVCVSPNQKWLLAQSLDNQILVYELGSKFRQHKKKRFVGHLISGYACQVNFSNDGSMVMSGDSSGNLFIWDWNTSKICKVTKCHDGVLISCQWHPIEASKVATCSWDGSIKLWD